MLDASPPSVRHPSDRFVTTTWSRVLRAAAPDDPASGPAWQELCRSYWYPLYAYARRRGSPPPEAEDAVQGFFAWLFEANALRHADPARGRFRGFLAAAFRQFLAKQHEHAAARRRCPAGAVVSIDAATGEDRYRTEPTDHLTPDRAFEYAWARAVLERAMDRLRAECEAGRHGHRFEAFRGILTDQVPVAAVGEALGLSDGAVRVAVHRLRRRYGELLREEVAGTLESPADVEQELRDLLAAVAGV